MKSCVRISPIVFSAALLLGCDTGPQPPAEPTFEAAQPDVLGAPGTLTNAWADFDLDGDPDLFVGFNGHPNRLYRNDEGTLVEVASEVGIAESRRTRTSAWGDYDSDGDPDLFLGFAGDDGPTTRLYRNDGGVFVDMAPQLGLLIQGGATRQASWVDVDADGDLDLFLALRDGPNAMFLNNGRSFDDGARELGLADPRRSVGAIWFDFQEDGDLDLLVANMDGDANGLFRNVNGSFTDVASEVGLAGGGRGLGDEAHGSVRPCAADVDNDGTLELFFANYGPNGLFRWQEEGGWQDISAENGLDIDGRYDSCEFGDFDGDGRVDLFVNGTVTGGTQYRDYLFRNTEEGFVDVTPESLLKLDADHGAQWVDYDADGDLDLSLAGATETGMHFVMRNLTRQAGNAASLMVSVVDEGGNATVAGAEVRVYQAGTEDLLGMRIVDTGSGYNTQSVLPVQFGLARKGRVDIEVTLPGRGKRAVTRLENVNPGDHVGEAVVVSVRR